MYLRKKRIDGGKYAGFCQIRCCFLYMSLFPFAMSRLSLFHYNFGRIPCFQSILFQSHRSNAFQISQCYLNFEAIFHKKNWPFSVDITRCVFICEAFIFFHFAHIEMVRLAFFGRYRWKKWALDKLFNAIALP